MQNYGGKINEKSVSSKAYFLFPTFPVEFQCGRKIDSVTLPELLANIRQVHTHNAERHILDFGL